MALRDYGDGARSVERRGRRWTCRPPSTLAVQLFLELYGLEALALAVAYRARPWPSASEALVNIAPQLLEDARSADVLAACCSVDCGESGDARRLLAADPVLRALVARESLAQCDAARIVRSLGLDRAVDAFFGRRAADPDASGAFEQSVVALAERFGIDPSAVAAWPYERFLSAWESLEALGRRRRAAAAGEPQDDAPTIGIDDLAAFFGQQGA